MNFDFSEEQKLLQQTARDFLKRRAPLDSARAVLEGGLAWDEALWKGVAEMGWLGAAVPESYGGAGFGRLELALIAQELGRALAPIPFAPSVYVVTEALLERGSEEQKERYLPRLVSGELIGTFAITERPGRLDAEHVEARFADGRVEGTKLPVPDLGVAGLALTAVRCEGLVRLALVDLEGEGVTKEPLETLDGSRPQGRLTLSGAPAELLGLAGGDVQAIHQVLDRAAVVIGFEQLGGATRALEMTREFALGRYAFGRPIASFQAIKHRMADLYAKIEIARSNGYYAAWALRRAATSCHSPRAASAPPPATPSRLAAQEMIQIHGGVGYTWEYDCHLFYRRAALAAASIGTASAWRDQLVTLLVEGHDDAHAE
jgi:acyl-CoA dehydrogenase